MGLAERREGRSAEDDERNAASARGRATPDALQELRAPQLPGVDAALVYSLLAENVRDYALFLMDPQGIIRYWGDAARLMKWWTRDEAEGAHLRLLYPAGGADDGTAEAHLAEAAASGEYTGEGHRLRRDGSLFWAYVTLTALRSPDGRLHGFAKVTRDFSARRAVEGVIQRERHAEPHAHHDKAELERLRRVVKNLSHELRTPLTSILGSIELLAGPSDQASEAAHLRRLQRNAGYLLAAVDDLLQLSRAEGGEITLHPAERRLSPVLANALSSVEADARTRGVTLTHKVSGTAGDLPYWGDERRVHQVLVALLRNAITCTAPGSHVTVSGGTAITVTGTHLASSGPWLYVRVEDTGPGIPAERLDALFEADQQAANHDASHRLDLASSRQLARLMGGDISVESQPGLGSQFTLWLPITTSGPVPR